MPNYAYYTTITFTTSAAHGLAVGQRVSVSGNSYAPFNLTNAVVTSVPTSTTFKVNFTSSTLQSGTGGNETPQSPSLVREAGTVTATTSAAHNFQPGWTAQISGFASVVAGSAATAQYSNGLVTVTTTAPHGLPVNTSVVLSGASDASFNTPNGQLVTSVPSPTTFTLSFTPLSSSATGITVSVPWNGNYTIASIPTPTSFTYADVGPDGSASASGTASIIGNIVGGTHQVSVFFVTEEETFTRPAPPVTFTANGGELLKLDGIAVGPPNVKKRIITLTPVITPPATEGSFYHTVNMVISDNVTVSAIIDVSDTDLQATSSLNSSGNTADDLLFFRSVLAESSGCIGYADRMFWWGTRNRIQNFVNMGFDGGYDPPSGMAAMTNGSSIFTFTSGAALLDVSVAPLGSPLVINGVAFTLAGVSGPNITLNSPWTGATGNYLCVLYSPYSPVGTAQINQNTPPGWTNASSGTGTANFGVSLGASTGFSLSLATVAGGDVAKVSQSAYQDVFGDAIVQPSTTYQIRFLGKSSSSSPVTFSISSASTGFSTTSAITLPTVPTWLTASLDKPLPSPIPPDMTFSITNSTVPSTATIDEIGICDATIPGISSTLTASFAYDPEGFDGDTGLVTVAPSNGQNIRSCFQILDSKLYIVKEHSLHWTQDDGSNEPALWTTTEVSDEIGTPSVRGVAVGEGWAVIAARQGAYIFWGGEPQKISQEIQPDWDTINWEYGHRIYTVVDLANKRVHIGAPTGSAQWPNVEFVLDYRGLQTGPEIASAWSVHYSSYTNKILTIGDARKWTIWNLQANSAAMVERPDGTQHLFRGNGAGTGKVYDQLGSQLSDDGATINSYYDTYFMPSHQEEEQMRVSSDQKLFGYLKARIGGSGFVTFYSKAPDNSLALLGYFTPLGDTALYDAEFQMDVTYPRLSFRIQSNAVGSKFQLTKLIPFMQQSPTMAFRGT